MNGLEKPVRKNSDQKNRKNSKNLSEIAACEHKTPSEKEKFGSNKKLGLNLKNELRMNWENHLEKNPIQNSKKQ